MFRSHFIRKLHQQTLFRAQRTTQRTFFRVREVRRAHLEARLDSNCASAYFDMRYARWGTEDKARTAELREQVQAERKKYELLMEQQHNNVDFELRRQTEREVKEAKKAKWIEAVKGKNKSNRSSQRTPRI